MRSIQLPMYRCVDSCFFMYMCSIARGREAVLSRHWRRSVPLRVRGEGDRVGIVGTFNNSLTVSAHTTPNPASPSCPPCPFSTLRHPNNHSHSHSLLTKMRTSTHIFLNVLYSSSNQKGVVQMTSYFSEGIKVTYW